MTAGAAYPESAESATSQPGGLRLEAKAAVLSYNGTKPYCAGMRRKARHIDGWYPSHDEAVKILRFIAEEAASDPQVAVRAPLRKQRRRRRAA